MPSPPPPPPPQKKEHQRQGHLVQGNAQPPIPEHLGWLSTRPPAPRPARLYRGPLGFCYAGSAVLLEPRPLHRQLADQLQAQEVGRRVGRAALVRGQRRLAVAEGEARGVGELRDLPRNARWRGPDGQGTSAAGRGTVDVRGLTCAAGAGRACRAAPIVVKALLQHQSFRCIPATTIAQHAHTLLNTRAQDFRNLLSILSRIPPPQLLHPGG
mmetsp:Transcript_115493/g.337839  ORF Transcript_115493/g.337839 Transcript_115493/m.337839 type:complete len:212 (+) Transcript_115493:257-892(+)